MTTIEEVLGIAQAHGIRMHGFNEQFDSTGLDEWRESRNALSEIDSCREWIKAAERRKTINKLRGSYGLKHTVERLRGKYVSNGSFIVAAILEGLVFSRNGPNAYFNLATKSLRNRQMPAAS